MQLLVEPDPIPGSMQFYSIPNTICNVIGSGTLMITILPDCTQLRGRIRHAQDTPRVKLRPILRAQTRQSCAPRRARRRSPRSHRTRLVIEPLDRQHGRVDDLLDLVGQRRADVLQVSSSVSPSLNEPSAGDLPVNSFFTV